MIGVGSTSWVNFVDRISEQSLFQTLLIGQVMEFIYVITLFRDCFVQNKQI